MLPNKKHVPPAASSNHLAYPRPSNDEPPRWPLLLTSDELYATAQVTLALIQQRYICCEQFGCALNGERPQE
eukprot:6177866-Pleurochrysis_carterae.AAC.1